MNKSKGFTLIELMIVISIIAVLSIIGAVLFSGATKSARDSKRIQDLKAISTALQLYQMNNGTAPINQTAYGYCQSSTQNLLPELVTGEFMKAVPTDPLYNGTNGWGYCYYNYGANNSTGMLVVGKLEAIADTTTPPPGSCRPFNTTNWCSSTVATKYYCICNPY